MGYQMWCEAVRSAILATAWLLIFDVPLCSDVKSSRPLWPRGASASASKRLLFSYWWSFGTEPLFISVFGDIGP